MKKILLILTIVGIMLCFMNISVLAASNENEIPFSEYAKIMTDAYRQAGVEIEIITPSEPIHITEEILQNDLSKVKEIAQDIKDSSDEPYLYSDTNIFDTNLVYPNAMYGNISCYGTKYITDTSDVLIIRSATIQVSASVRVDFNNNTIVTGYSPSLSLQAATGYDDYIVLLSYSTTKDNSSTNLSNHSITYNISCQLKEETSIGAVTSWAKVTKNFSIKFSPFK